MVQKTIIKIGVIGTGVMGRNHVRVLNELGVLTAISDNNIKTLKHISKKHKVKQAYIDHNEMLKKEDLDGVVIATSTRYHKTLVLDCIKQGVNILVEKPIALKLNDAQEMITKAKKKGIIFTVGHIERFNPVVTKIKKLLKTLGKIDLVNCARVSPYPKRSIAIHEGILIDIGVHDFDIIQYLFGAVSDFHTRMIFSGKQDIYVKSIFKINKKIMGSMELSWISPKKERTISIYGKKGMFKGDLLNKELLFYGDTTTKKYSIINKEPLKLELQHFIDCIKHNKKPLVSPEEAMGVLKTVADIYDKEKS